MKLFMQICGKMRRTAIIDIPIALIVGFSITAAGVVILAVCLLLCSISEEMVDVGILIIYIISCFGAGMIIGRKRKTRRFLWGMLIGVVYYSVLYLTSFLLVGPSHSVMNDVVTTLMICCGGATIGGMLS